MGSEETCRAPSHHIDFCQQSKKILDLVSRHRHGNRRGMLRDWFRAVHSCDDSHGTLEVRLSVSVPSEKDRAPQKGIQFASKAR